MSEYKHKAIAVANRLHQENRIDCGDYTTLMEGQVSTVRRSGIGSTGGTARV